MNRLIYMRLVGVVVASTVCVTPLTAKSQSCETFARVGWYDTTGVSTSHRRLWTYLQFLRTEEARSIDSARKTGLTLRIPVGDVMAAFGFSDSQEGLNLFRALSESAIDQKFSDVGSFEATEKKISPDVAELIRECLTQPGVHAYAESKPGSTDFAVVVRYNALPRQNRARVSIRPAAPMRCDANAFVLEGSQTHSLLCTRAAMAGPKPITVNSDAPLSTGAVLWVYAEPPSIKLAEHPRINDGLLTTNATIHCSADGLPPFDANHIGAHFTLPYGGGPNMGYAGQTSCAALTRATIRTDTEAPTDIERTLDIVNDIGGQCGPNNTGGEGWLTPGWNTDVILPSVDSKGWRISLNASSSAEGVANYPDAHSPLQPCTVTWQPEGLAPQQLLRVERRDGTAATAFEQGPGRHSLRVDCPTIQRGCLGAAAGTVGRGTAAFTLRIRAVVPR